MVQGRARSGTRRKVYHFGRGLDMFYGLARRRPPPMPLNPNRRYSPERAWEKLSDDEWAVLSPFVFRHSAAAGRPVRDPRTRLDAIFWLAAHTLPGRAAPPWAA